MAKKLKSRRTAPGRRKAVRASSVKSRSTRLAGLRAGRKVEADPVAAAPAPRLKKSPLSKAELKGFRQMLLEKRRALVGDMGRMEAEAFRGNRQDRSGDLSNIPIHPADIGTDNYEQEFTLGLLESERTLLREIDTALERIDQGTYGICIGTGQAIDKARLRARPWARYCIEYARMVEKGLVQPRQEQPPAPDEEEEDTDTEAQGEGEAAAPPPADDSDSVQDDDSDE